MNTVLFPAVFFIDENEWLDEAKKDDFLQHFLDILETIEEYQHTQIYWSEDWEFLLWEHPQIPPWRQDKSLSNSIIPLIYKLFPANQLNVVDVVDKSFCETDPPIKYPQSLEEIYKYFFQFVHLFLKRKEQVYLAWGANQKDENTKFFYQCHDNDLDYHSIFKAIDWLPQIDAIELFWNESKITEQSFRKAIGLVHKQEIDLETLPNSYVLSKKFMKSIQNRTKHKKEIVYAIVKRLSLTSAQAGRDGQLQDEYLTAKKEFRFRVTQRPSSTRIHYNYVKEDEKIKKINFLAYYRKGEHDDGL